MTNKKWSSNSTRERDGHAKIARAYSACRLAEWRGTKRKFESVEWRYLDDANVGQIFVPIFVFSIRLGLLEKRTNCFGVKVSPECPILVDFEALTSYCSAKYLATLLVITPF